MKRVLITGATGQDGRYLIDAIRREGSAMEVVALGRRCEFGVCQPIDLGVKNSLLPVFESNIFDYIYHLGGVSHPRECESDPDWARRVNVEATRSLVDLAARFSPDSRIFLASSCLIFGNSDCSPQTEETKIQPIGVYAETKAALIEIAASARTRGQFVSVGILYNHESPLRSSDYVSRKIAGGAMATLHDREFRLKLGNLNAVRDWSHARDFVDGFRRALRAPEPDNFIFASGQGRTVADFCSEAYKQVGLDWRCHVDGVFDTTDGAAYVGNSAKARSVLGWCPEIEFSAMVSDLVQSVATESTSESSGRKRKN